MGSGCMHGIVHSAPVHQLDIKNDRQTDYSQRKMKNPWKRLSKINPQREDGTRQINSCVLDALIKAKLPTAEMSVVLTIISKTWGFNKSEDAISTGQFVESTDLTDRAVKQARVALKEKRIIHFEPSKRVKRGSPINSYMFNKHYDTWKIQYTKKGEQRFTGERKRKKRVNGTTPTIETNTIEKTYADSSESATQDQEFYTTKKGRKLQGKRLESFKRFWEAFDYKRGKAAAADAWYDIPTLTGKKVEEIVHAAEVEASMRKDIIAQGQTPKWAQGWITERRWEDEHYYQNNTEKIVSVFKVTSDD